MNSRTPPPGQWPDDTYLVIPAYKAAAALNGILPSLLAMVPASQVCVIDDGSKDTTEGVCERFGVACIKHPRNKGKGASLKTGFAFLMRKGARWIMTMDADGQHAPGDIPVFLDAAVRYPESGIIIGMRSISPFKMPPARIFSNTVTSAFLSLICRRRIRDSQCGFRLYSTELLSACYLSFNHFEMESEIIVRACLRGFPVQFVPVQTLYCSSQSHISHLVDMLRWIAAVLVVWVTAPRSRKRSEQPAE